MPKPVFHTSITYDSVARRVYNVNGIIGYRPTAVPYN